MQQMCRKNLPQKFNLNFNVNSIFMKEAYIPEKKQSFFCIILYIFIKLISRKALIVEYNDYHAGQPFIPFSELGLAVIEL